MAMGPWLMLMVERGAVSGGGGGRVVVFLLAGDDVVWRKNGVSADVFGEQCQSLFSRHVE